MPEDKNKHLGSDEDYQLFRESMNDVTPLLNNQKHYFKATSKPKPVTKNFPLEPAQSYFTDHQVNDIQSDDSLFFSRDGVQHKTIKQLKRGILGLDETVDLHGLNQQEAQHYLYEFLEEQAVQRHRCILVIHGKGAGSLNNRPVLKNLVFNMLKNEPTVLAFCSAQPRHGGVGAVYVLLKKAT